MDRHSFVAEQAALGVAESAPDLQPDVAGQYPKWVAEALDILAAEEGPDPLEVGAPFAALYARTYARIQAGDLRGEKRLKDDRRRWLRAVAAAERLALREAR